MAIRSKLLTLGEGELPHKVLLSFRRPEEGVLLLYYTTRIRQLGHIVHRNLGLARGMLSRRDIDGHREAGDGAHAAVEFGLHFPLDTALFTEPRLTQPGMAWRRGSP